MPKLVLAPSFRARLALSGLLVLLAASPVFPQGGFDGPGRYVINNVKSGKVMDLDRNDQTTIIQFSDRGTDNQAWDIERAAGGYFYLRNVMNGNALEAAGNGNSSPVRGIPFNGGPAQQWRFDTGKDGNALIMNRNGKTLDVPDGTGKDGARLQIYSVDGDSNQRFTFRHVNANMRGGNFGSNVRRGNDRVQGDPYGSTSRRSEPNRANDSYRNNSGSAANSYYDDRDKIWKLSGDGICFYRDRNYRGEAFCRAPGDDVPNVGPNFNDSFSSVKFFGRVQSVEAYENENFGGDHIRIQNDQPDLSRMKTRSGASFEDRISSFRVY